MDEADDHQKNFLFRFAYLWSAFAMLYLFGVSFFVVPEKNQHIVDTAVGFLLGTIIAGFIGYFYGSSHSSKDKDETLKEVVEDGLTRKDDHESVQ
jgi:hypothetical protein